MQGSVVQPDTSTDEIFPETEPENVYTYNVNYSCVVFGDRLNIYSVYNEKLKKKNITICLFFCTIDHFCILSYQMTANSIYFLSKI